MIVEVSDEEVRSLTESIFARYGLDFTCYEPKSLKRRILRILSLHDFASIHDLWVRILKDPSFVQVFMNEISVGMTSMFRDPILWKQLKRTLNIEFGAKPSFSIWHTGCSTGEEVYSMGILLNELQLLEKAKSLATDINQNAIDNAQSGIYHKIKMLENENNFNATIPFKAFGNYFTRQGDFAVMSQNLIKNVTFKYHNLITDTYPTGFDLIFCRNVMIYFDNLAKEKILNRFYESLNPGGLLIIGFFDTMGHLFDTAQFELIEEKAKIFKKR